MFGDGERYRRLECVCVRVRLWILRDIRKRSKEIVSNGETTTILWVDSLEH